MRGSRSFFAIACFSVASVAAGCKPDGPRADAEGATRPASPSSGAGPDASGDRSASTDPRRARTETSAREPSRAGDGGSGLERSPTATAPVDRAAVATDPYLEGHPIAAKSIGHTSYVLKVRLDSGLAGAYKPRSTLPLGCCRYKGEIAAYRLARALGLNNVPYAMPRAFLASELRAAFTSREQAEDFDHKALVDPDERVRGAFIPWIERYEELALEQPEWRARWERWLTDPAASVADADRSLARAISTLLAFDYVSANWDRWSGGNVAVDGATHTLLFVDNDGAFYDVPPQAALARQASLLKRVIRYSRGFVASLRALDAAGLRDAFGQNLRGDPLLSARVVDDVDARRKTLLAIIDAHAARLGTDVVYAFE